MKKDIKKIIQVPEGNEIKISDKHIVIKNGNEEVTIQYKIRDFLPKLQGNEIILEKKASNKRDKMLINSLSSHIACAFKGMDKKYEYRLQICSIHFPMNAKIEKDHLIVKNFFGERKDRVLKITPGVEVKIENDIIIVQSPSKHLAGEQASEIEALTRIKSRDRRVFQDGIWIIKKSKGRKNEED